MSVYGLLVGLILLAWNRIPVQQSGKEEATVSVVIAVRNEHENIVKTLDAVFQNIYAKELFEVIVVNDHSTDDTLTVLQSYSHQKLTVISLSSDEHGKKSAITMGVRHAKGDLIICTDGDTVVTKDWIRKHVKSFNSGNQLSFGGVRYFSGPGTAFLNLELIALVGVGASLMHMGKPSMINGCNYSFSREAFLEVAGFSGNDHLATGDDEFLLRKIHHRYSRRQIAFLKSFSAVVSTEPPGSWSAFYHQRKRWASKWRHHRDWMSRITAPLVFLFYTVFLFVICNIMIIEPLVSLCFILSKVLMDYLLLSRLSTVTQSRPNMLAIFMMQIIYPLYVIFFGLAANFGIYKWKDRSHNT